MSLRILRIIRSMDGTSGGPAEGIRQQTALMQGLGHQTTIVCLDPPGSIAAVAGARLIELGAGHGKFGFLRGATQRIREVAQDHDVAVIHGHWQYHGLAAWQALGGRLPYALFPHGMLDPWFNRTYPLKAIKKRLYWWLAEHRIVRDAAVVCFTSETERLLARTSFRPYSAKEAVVSYGTTPPPPASAATDGAFRTACPGLSGRPYLLFLSRIQEKKGCDLLISAFASIANLRPELMLVMAGPDQDGWGSLLRAQAAQFGIADRVCWPGMLRGDAKWGAFYGAEAFCLPSHQENFGIAVAEALACSIPVLISDQVNIWREILHDDAGLVEPDNQAGCNRLLARWIACPSGERVHMREAARRCFSGRFDISATINIQLAILEAACRGRPKEDIR